MNTTDRSRTCPTGARFLEVVGEVLRGRVERR
jgi:hypothetical protein